MAIRVIHAVTICEPDGGRRRQAGVTGVAADTISPALSADQDQVAEQPVVLRNGPLLNSSGPQTHSGQLAKQPRLCHFPITLDRFRRNLQDFCRFFDSQAAEVAELHDTTLARIDLGQRHQGVIKGQHVDTSRAGPEQGFVQRDTLGIPTSLRRQPAACVVHEDGSNDLRAQGKEVHAVLASNSGRANELEVGLIGQRGRFKRMVGRLAPQLLPGDPP